MTMLLPLPSLPIKVSNEPQVEPAPVTNTELFEELAWLPMEPKLLATVPPLEITRLLPLPSCPTSRLPSLP